MHTQAERASVRNGILGALAFTLALGSLLLGGAALLGTAVGVGAAPGALSLTPTATPCIPGWRIVSSPNPPGAINSLLTSVSAISPNDVWAVGTSSDAGAQSALIEHWDGSTWSIVPAPNPLRSAVLIDVAARAPDDVWAVGRYYPVEGQDAVTLILHWDGVVWSQVASPSPSETGADWLIGVAALAANDAWAVGYAGPDTLALHWDGSTWEVVATPNTGGLLAGITMLAHNDIWAVGRSNSGALTLHWDGVSWSVVPIAAGGFLRRVDAVSQDDIWAVGGSSSGSIAAHWDGVNWTLTSMPSGNYELEDVEAISPTEAWAVSNNAIVFRWNGSQWSIAQSPRPEPEGGRLLGIEATGGAGSELWAVGNSFDGSTTQTFTMHYTSPCHIFTPTPTPSACAPTWSIFSAPNPDDKNSLGDILALAPNDIWAVGITHNDVYTLGTLITHWNGVEWSMVPNSMVAGHLSSIDGTSSSNLWAVGSNNWVPLILHWDGAQWSIVPGPDLGGDPYALNSVEVIAPDDVWAVGSPGSSNGQALIIHWDGQIWSVVPSPVLGAERSHLRGVKANSPSDIWAVGSYTRRLEPWSRTLVMHWNGIEWTVSPSPNTGQGGNVLFDIDALASNDIWVAGYYATTTRRNALALHWDGAQWISVTMPEVGTRGSILYGIKALSANDIWAVGYYADAADDGGLAMHWDGTQWSVSPIADSGAEWEILNAVAPVSNNDVWAVGMTGMVISDLQSLIQRYAESCPATQTPSPTLTATNTPTSTSVAVTHTAPPQPTQTRVPTQPPTATATPCTLQFSDVEPGSTFYQYVMYLACRGVLGGYNDGTFRPNNPITRGQLSKVVSNGVGIEDPPGPQRFADVPPSHTFYLWVQRLAGRGHIGGYPCGGTGEPCGSGNLPYFRPQSEATRGQIAKIISNAVGLSGDPVGQTFADVPYNHAFYLWIERLVAIGAMGGYPCGGTGEPCDAQNRPYFRPGNNATRGQLCKILYFALSP